MRIKSALSLMLLHFLVTTGCAYTSVGREHQIYYSEIRTDNPNLPQVKVNCSNTVYAFMLSPVVPLPPVIPGCVFGDEYGLAWLSYKTTAGSDEISTIQLQFKNKEMPAWSFKNPGNRQTINTPFKCETLDQAKLYVKSVGNYLNRVACGVYWTALT